MTALLYHSRGSDAETSPFDDAVLRVAHGSDIKIVSPYISLRYLQRLIAVSTSWALVSDIEAWLSSLSISERARTLLFIHANLEKIHHFPAIHAKTVISPNLAYLGSANLTSMGILNRTEMGVLLEDIRLVEELNDWFDGLWTQTAPPDVAETIEFVQWLDQQALAAVAASPKKSLSSGGKKVRAHLANLAGLMVAPEQNATADLVEQLHEEHEEGAPDIIDIYELGVVDAIVDTLVADGFSFRAFVQAARRQGLQRDRQRDLYFSLLQFCANHPRSVFAADTINRLLFVDGTFVQSTPTQLNQQQASYDEYLSNLILALSFEETRGLPSSAQMFTLTGLRETHQRHLRKSLVESGLLLQADNTWNSQARYTLKKKFAWSRRFQLFAKAYKNWNKCLSRLAAENAASLISLAKAPDDAPAAVQRIESWPFVTNKKVADKPEAPSHATENEDAPVLAATRSVKPDPAALTPPEPPFEPLPRKAVRIIRSPDHAVLIETIEPVFKSEADRIDELYLHLAKILEPSSGYFNFKSIKAFAVYFYAHYQEDKEFIEQVFLGKINKPRLFYISINPERKYTSCTVKLNLDADMSDYQKTYKFMKESAEISKWELSTKKKRPFRVKSSPGFFARTVGYKALDQCEPERRNAAIKREDALRRVAFKKEEEAKQKTLAARQAYLEASTLDAIKKAYARAGKADQVFESLLFLVQLYGNPLPLDSETEVFDKIADRTGLKLQDVERIFGTQACPLTLSISKDGADSADGFCHVDLNHFYSGNFETLPLTKKLLAMAPLN